MGLLYFQETTFALTHRYPAAADQTRGKKKTKTGRKELLAFLKLAFASIKHFIYWAKWLKLPGHTLSLFYLRTQSEPWLLTCHLLFRSGTKRLWPSQLPFQSASLCVVRRTQPQKGANQGVLPHSCALARDLLPSTASAELLCRRSSGSSPFQTLLHSSSHFWLIVQLKVIWHPQFVLYWLNIRRQTIQYQFKAKSIKTRCYWQMQISPCRSEPCCIISVTEA